MYKPRSRRNCTLYSFPRTFAQIFSNAVQGQLRHIDGNITVIQFSRHASVDTTNVLSSYFTTVGMYRFAWSTVGTYFVGVGPNISEKFVPGEPILGGSIKRDRLFLKNRTTLPKKKPPSDPRVR